MQGEHCVKYPQDFLWCLWNFVVKSAHGHHWAHSHLQLCLDVEAASLLFDVVRVEQGCTPGATQAQEMRNLIG